MREVVQDIAPKFEAANGHRLSIAFATVGMIVKRIHDGESGPLLGRGSTAL